VGEDLVEAGENGCYGLFQPGTGGMDVAATAELTGKAIHIDQRGRIARQRRF
jgi:hypothetical protein